MIVPQRLTPCRALIGDQRQAAQAKLRSRWLRALIARRGKNQAAVALANKNARIVWALLAHDQAYRVPVTG